jgi:TPR repeat protein
MYYSGEGVSRDTDKAKEWFSKAAAQGNEEAKANLDAMK